MDLQQELGKRLKGFSELSAKDQRQLTILIFNAGAKRKRHKDLEDCSAFSYQELERRFGRGRFKKINEKLGVFVIAQTFSIKHKRTRAYALTEKVERILSNWLKRDLDKAEELIDAAGYAVRTLPAAIAAKKAGNITARAWRSAAVRNAVPVNLTALRNFHNTLQKYVEKAKLPIPADLFAPGVETTKLEDWLLETRKLIKLAHTRAGGSGVIPHRYVQATTGRLFATNVNLQTAPRQVRHAALTGCWDVDIENCHYSILMQMAAKFGKHCEQIEHYLNNKKPIRTAIAQRVGISAQQAKDCLLMALYGARFSEWGEAAIPRYIGASRAEALYADPAFKAITSEIRGAGAIITQAWPRSRKQLANAMGLWISETKDKAKLLAHLLQGVEALALKTIVQELGENVLLLMHDGFVCRLELSEEKLRELEQAVGSATGYRLRLEQKQIQIDLDLAHTRRIPDESKTSMTAALL